MKQSKGFTLLELMIAMFILTVGLLGILLTNTTSKNASVRMNERILALQDAQRVIELMRSTSSVGNFPGNVTNAYPNGSPILGFDTLTNEAISVDYTDIEADPLDVTVNVTWSELGTRDATTQLRTLITQRE